MSSSLEQFVWYRPEFGFEWITARTLRSVIQRSEDREGDKALGRYIVERKTDEPRYYRFNPIAANPTFFRRFAQLEPDEAAYAEFANTHGLLGIGQMLVREAGTYEMGEIAGEDFNDWREAQMKLRRVVDVLDAIQSRDIARLLTWFSITPRSVSYRREDSNGFIASIVSSPELNPGDFLWQWATDAKSHDDTAIRFAQGWAQSTINEAMAGHGERNESVTSARILFNRERGGFMLHLAPANLLAAMWLQCARVLTTNPTFRTCEHCGKWFELGSDARRRQSKYCSDRCKVAAYRLNKRKTLAVTGRHKSKPEKQ